MKHLCIGSYVRIMTSCAIPAERRFDRFCEKLLLSLCPEGTTTLSYQSGDRKNNIIYSDTNFGKIHSSSQDLPVEIKRMALNKDAHAIEKYFKNKIIPVLDEGRKKNAVYHLKEIILEDESIVDETQLGSISSLTKNELKTKNTFILSEFLTDVFIYAVARTNNKEEKASFTRNIKKDYCAAKDPASSEISFYEVTKPRIKAAIPNTSKGNFDKIFASVSSERLPISASHDFQIFCLKFDDFDFDYYGLQKHLRNNIGYYVYSRAQIKKYLDDDEISSLAYDAIAHIKNISKDKISNGNELGELLLYIFLEQVLNAPKLMSSVEIKNHSGSIEMESADIHLLTADAMIPFSQIIIGTSNINDSLHIAIDSAFAAAQKLKDRKTNVRRFVESNIFAESFPDEVYAQLESIILPSEKNEKKPDTAFGMFLGYSLKDATIDGKSVDEYQRYVFSLLKEDILRQVPFIKSKISQYGLEGYSLYIYLLPFKNADVDKIKIMDKLLQLGEVHHG